MQEFRTGATRQNMETTHVKEESKRLRSQLADLRDKLADLDAKVANNNLWWRLTGYSTFLLLVSF